MAGSTMGVSKIFKQDFVNDRMDAFLPAIIERLDIKLELPHEFVIEEDHPYPEDRHNDTSIWYIGRGECKVKVSNGRAKPITVAILRKGEHFGETQLIYQCARTASVQSLNYNTHAFMESDKYKRLI